VSEVQCLIASCKELLALSWNVRGLGDMENCEESKLHDITTTFKAKTFLPPSLADSFMHSGASGTRGGLIITVWNACKNPCNLIRIVHY
jgi:hypothetical protein